MVPLLFSSFSQQMTAAGAHQAQSNFNFANLLNHPPTQNQPRRDPQSALRQRVFNEATQIRNYYLENPDQLNMILHQNPSFAEKVVNEDMTDLMKHVEESIKKKQAEKQARMKKIMEINADPMNPDAQKHIEEEIRKANVEENRYLPLSQTLNVSF